MPRLELKRSRYWDLVKARRIDMSRRLFCWCWRQYLELQDGGDEAPLDDDDVLAKLEMLAGLAVNNPRSSFYLYGD